MTKGFNVARIDSTQAIIGAKSLWKKVVYYCLNYDIYCNPRFKLYTIIGKSSKKKEETIANAA